MQDKESIRVFEIVDEMYHIFKVNNGNPEIMKVLLKAGKALNDNAQAPIVAAKTVNGITLVILSSKLDLDRENSSRVSELINELTRISRTSVYKWSSNGVGDLRVQFRD